MYIIIILFLSMIGFKKTSLAKDSNRILDYKKQVIQLTKQIQTDKRNVELILKRGMAYFYIKKYKLAIEDFSTIIVSNSTQNYSFLWRGASYFYLEKYKKAIYDLSFFLKKEPLNTDALVFRGRSYFYLKKYQKAIKDFTQALKNGRNIKDILYLRAQTYFKLDLYSKGLGDLNKATRFIDFFIILGLSLFFSLGISSVFVCIAFFKRNLNKPKFLFIYQKYQGISSILLLFLFLFIAQETLLFQSFFEFIFYLVSGNETISHLSFIFFISLIIYLFKVFKSTIPTFFIDRRVKGTTIKFRRYLKLSSLVFVYFFLIQIGFFSYSIILQLVTTAVLFEKILSFMLICIFVFLFMSYFPQLIAFFYGIKKGEGELYFKLLNTEIQKSEVRLKKIKVVRTKDLKLANAMAAGLYNRYIFITDYLINQLNPEEIGAVLCHELGHIKKNHLWINFGLILFYLISSYYIRQLIGDSLFIFFAYFILFFVFIFRYISRKLEYSADQYAVEVYDKPAALITSLEKLGLYNVHPLKIKKFDEKTMTHPSIHKRIEEIEKLIEQKENIFN